MGNARVVWWHGSEPDGEDIVAVSPRHVEVLGLCSFVLELNCCQLQLVHTRDALYFEAVDRLPDLVRHWKWRESISPSEERNSKVILSFKYLYIEKMK